MKKNLLIAIALCLFTLNGCSINSNNIKIPTNHTTHKENAPKNGEKRNTIEIKNTPIIYEDENIQIELLSFAESYHNFDIAPRWIAEISYKIYNKSTIDLSIGFDNVYVGDEKATIVNSGTEVAAEKSAISISLVEKINATGSAITEYSSKDLYDLNGKVKVYNSDLNIYYTAPFDLNGVK